MFRIGDTVICINDSIPAEKKEKIEEDYLHWVKKDKEYTIRDIQNNDGIVVGVLLEECYNYPLFIPLLGRMAEPMFRLDRFRKIASAEIQLFKEEYSEEFDKVA